jgi:threonine/homoserine/homoserine lactone efflux protein
MLLWAGAGSVLRRFLKRPRILRAFNISMAVQLAASIVPGLVELAVRWRG